MDFALKKFTNFKKKWELGKSFILGECEHQTQIYLESIRSAMPLLWIRSGGSSGKEKWIAHDADSLGAAVRSFQKTFQVSRINSHSVLPFRHISGFMPFYRAWISGGICQYYRYEKIKTGIFPMVESGFFLSLVPTQLRNLINMGRDAIKWLAQYQKVFVGGAPLNIGLWQKALSHSIELVPVYGMSETAAMVACATYKQNEPVLYKPLWGVKVDSSNGILNVQTNALARFIWDSENSSTAKLITFPWSTQDRAKMDPSGFFEILGRKDRAVISGGVTIFPEKLESLLAQHGLDKIFFFGIPDAYWGERLVGLGDLSRESKKDRIFEILTQKLTKEEIPKNLYFTELPKNDRGKYDFNALKKCAFSLASSSQIHNT